MGRYGRRSAGIGNAEESRLTCGAFAILPFSLNTTTQTDCAEVVGALSNYNSVTTNNINDVKYTLFTCTRFFRVCCHDAHQYGWHDTRGKGRRDGA